MQNLFTLTEPVVACEEDDELFFSFWFRVYVQRNVSLLPVTLRFHATFICFRAPTAAKKRIFRTDTLQLDRLSLVIGCWIDTTEAKRVKMGVFLDFVFDNTYTIDANEAEASMRRKVRKMNPRLTRNKDDTETDNQDAADVNYQLLPIWLPYSFSSTPSSSMRRKRSSWRSKTVVEKAVIRSILLRIVFSSRTERGWAASARTTFLVRKNARRNWIPAERFPETQIRYLLSLVPYDTILAFAVQSAGSLLDQDCELHVWSTGYPKISINFSKSNVDLFQIYQFFNVNVKFQSVRGTGDAIDSTPPKLDKKQTKAGNVVDWIGDNARQVDPKTVEERLKTEFPILLAHENVELAFQSGRDLKVFTDIRILMVDVKGLVGKKIEFLTILYG
eukprot:scaffold2518_cov178-Amphora_coffeaeformis.AAC.2